MAGMEELEIHSKSYLVRWVNVRGGHTISWSIQPHKKSINFGIFKRLGQPTPSGSTTTTTTTTTNHDSHSELDLSSTDNLPASALIDKLRGAGLKPIQWVGKCEADKISQGTCDVPLNEGGNYALVFDNTFSKTTGKMATFVLVTYPTATPPQSVHQVHPPHALASVNNIGAPGNRVSPRLRPTNSSSTSIDNPRPAAKGGRSVSGGKSIKQRPNSNSVSSINGAPELVHTGILQKRRRKRHQGWARRFFSLDYASSTLSYYHDRNSSALRGAIPLNLAAVAANAARREISIDSGAEIWHLRANNETDFAAWTAALEKASKQSKEDKTARPASPTLQIPSHSASRTLPNPAEDLEWEQIESLVSKISGSRDAVRRLAKDTDPKYFTSSASSAPLPPLERRRSQSPHLQASPADGSPVNGEDYFGDSHHKRPFWKRKTSSNTTSGSAKRQPNGTTHLATPSPSTDAFPVTATEDRKPRSVISHHTDKDDDIHENLMAILRDLDKTVVEFTTLIAESKERRHPQTTTISSRVSMDSEASQEFFDAEAGPTSPLLTIQHDSDVEAENEDEEEDVDDDALSSCSEGDTRSDLRKGIQKESSAFLFPGKPKSMIPLPLDRVQRRNIVPAPTVPPPSLIGFLRKNVGKDLSAVSMPVTANEPLSLLQRAAECMEYSTLLDKAASAIDGLERLVYVTAFALSPLSSARVKDRAIRKPFNPLLGETFELVREDRGFRMIVEKVSHRPVQLAYQADSHYWSLTQSPKPTQKFWGKSAEINTDGKTRLSLHSSGDHFSWGNATSFLRNIIAGEKYVEPVGEMVVVNETTGQKTITTFKAGGMFSGRSEEITVKAFDVHGNELPLGLAGTWTNSLQLTEHGSTTNKTIWSVGPLVDQAAKRYGFPVFAATLNETTPIEYGKLPPTDSRLRPDQRALENNEIDAAEDLKAKLEEKQRERRKELEDIGGVYKPRWFLRVDTPEILSQSGSGTEEVIWKLKTGRDGYWEERARGEWNGVVPIFKL
ncbi:oxysterol binding protein (Osh3), putative [Talaromyces stipitatus ATCC 10500]|uniref:Oxysterol binding protein (Osh3), putative n=1 Tax=Talaromyces stipitatus (strain ATCC 10500 / CBS 375.48 / QM 6759 / NRRL 1006) TaxID=441959 RepID=B8MNH9_TALSN|nr:oxysterol binding protein (Osh3), putative [Talaromyces stipitatus ATCC 10500]EED14068.1 oxysterol binding protein (Osh3), putative [Talaromyces stipitatus ATCC 10500]